MTPLSLSPRPHLIPTLTGRAATVAIVSPFTLKGTRTLILGGAFFPAGSARHRRALHVFPDDGDFDAHEVPDDDVADARESRAARRRLEAFEDYVDIGTEGAMSVSFSGGGFLEFAGYLDEFRVYVGTLTETHAFSLSQFGVAGTPLAVPAPPPPRPPPSSPPPLPPLPAFANNYPVRRLQLSASHRLYFVSGVPPWRSSACRLLIPHFLCSPRSTLVSKGVHGRVGQLRNPQIQLHECGSDHR